MHIVQKSKASGQQLRNVYYNSGDYGHVVVISYDEARPGKEIS